MKTPGTAYTSVKTVRERQRKRPPLSAPPPSPPYLSLTSPPPSQLYFAEDMNPRCRSTMEDASAVVDGFGGDGGTGYFGVYDGHGGRNVAEFLRLHLHVNVERELQVKGDRSVEECLRAAFLYTDLSCHATGEQASGSTSVVCIVRRAGAARCVYTANCGDARAVLCHGAAAVRLSKDHKATDAAERARIEAGGGFVVRKRVMGVLAVARSFGDFTLKKFVSAEPYTSTTVLSEEVRARPRASRARPRATRGTARLTPPPPHTHPLPTCCGKSPAVSVHHHRVRRRVGRVGGPGGGGHGAQLFGGRGGARRRRARGANTRGRGARKREQRQCDRHGSAAIKKKKNLTI
jgi:serine/threonine protein phosphatase PrpC